MKSKKIIIRKKEFKNYVIKEFEPSDIEKRDIPKEIYYKNSHFASINWKRYYYILKYFQEYRPEDCERILDIGAYPGTLVRLLRMYLKNKAEISVVGLNFGEEFLNEMKKIDVECFETDVDPPYYKITNHPFPFTLQFKDDYFDFIFACEIIEHLFNPQYLLSEIKRVLKPNGTLLLTTDNITDIGNIFNLLKGNTINQDLRNSHVYKNSLTNRCHVRIYTGREIKILLDDIGLKDIKISLMNIQHKQRKYSFLKRISYYIRNLFYLIPRYRPRIFACCKK